MQIYIKSEHDNATIQTVFMFKKIFVVINIQYKTTIR